MATDEQGQANGPSFGADERPAWMIRESTGTRFSSLPSEDLSGEGQTYVGSLLGNDVQGDGLVGKASSG